MDFFDGDDDEVLEALEDMASDNHPDLMGALLEAVDHPSQQVRAYAALVLAQEFQDVRALPGLYEGLYDRNRPFQRAAADAIWEIGDTDPAGLIRALHFERGTVRDTIVEALDLIGWIPDEVQTEVTYRIATRNWRDLIPMGAQAVPGLVSALNDPDGNIRRGAAWALGQIGDGRAVPFLADLLSDESGDLLGIGGRVCDVAADALTRIGTPEALEALNKWTG